MGRGLMIALAASLALNVFAAGYISAKLVGHQAPPSAQSEPRGFENPFRLMRHAEALPAETREAFRAAIEDKLPTLRSEHEKTRRLRRELATLIAGEEWNREEIAAQMSAIRETQARQREAFDAAFLAAFETLSAEDRRLLMEAAEKRRMKRRERFKRRREERRDPPPPEE